MDPTPAFPLQTPSQAAPAYLTSRESLAEHVAAPAKAERYAAMLRSFGVDPTVLEPLANHPCAVVAEQPGCWFYGEDHLRHRLLRALRVRVDLHPLSGVRTLFRDAFSTQGTKHFFTSLYLHRGLRPVSLLGSRSARSSRHRCYDRVTLAAPQRKRLAAVLSQALDLLEAARQGPRALARASDERLRQEGQSLRAFSPRESSWKEVSESMLRCDLAAAGAVLERTRDRIREGESWAAYWTAVNEDFYGEPIGRLEPLFDRFLLAIADPVRAARTLARHAERSGQEPVPLAGIVTRAGKYRLVCWDPLSEGLFYRPDGHARVGIGWDDVLERVESGGTGGPAGVLAYLMLAAAGYYLVVDRQDGWTRLELQARSIHHLYTGLPFPMVAPPDPSGEPDDALLDVFDPLRREEADAAIASFFR